MCDINQVEVMKLLKLTSDSVTPITFSIPRADHLKPYFQDDLYRSIRSNESSYTITDWTNKSTIGSHTSPQSDTSQPYDVCSSSRYPFVPIFQSLKPSNMINLSERPLEEALLSAKNKNKNPTFRSEIEAKEIENQSRDSEFLRLQALAVQRSLYHPNKSSSSQVHKEGGATTIGSVGSVVGGVTSSTTTRPLSRCVDATPIYDEPDSDDEERWN